MRPFTRRRFGAVAVAASLAFAAGAASGTPAGAAAPPVVVPRAETAALFDDDEGGNANADDPAIWRNSADPDASLVIATHDQRVVQALPGAQVLDLNEIGLQRLLGKREQL